MALKSIYTVKDWSAATAYVKNDIVLVRSNIGASGVPQTIKYYYALKDNTNKTPPTYNNQYWQGYVNANNVAVPYFSWTPSYNVSVNHNPKTVTVNFGNSYEQRVPDGIFNNLINVSAKFDMRSELEATAIIHFLRARKGAESFCLKHLPAPYNDIPGLGYKKRFVCSSFQSNFVFHNNYTVSATFIQKSN